MRIKIGFIRGSLQEEGRVYLAPSGASYESFTACAVRYLVSDNLLGNPCTACTTFLYFLKKH